MNSQVQLLADPVELIHIPRSLYPHFLHPILNLLLLLPDSSNDLFIHISLSPLECSVICPAPLAHSLFDPIIANLNLNLSCDQDRPSISSHQYFVLQIDGEGNAQVVELAQPLSRANIPIFFISSYFSDYLLAPLPAKSNVLSILDDEGFTFSSMSNSYTYSSPARSPSPMLDSTTTTTTTTTNVNILETPISVDTNEPLLVVGLNNNNNHHLLPITRLLVESTRYFAVTMAPNEPVSLIIPQSKSHFFDNLLLGYDDSTGLVPIILNLTSLPENATGIVYKLASILENNHIPMTYLSFVKAACVLVSQSHIHSVRDTLQIPPN